METEKLKKNELSKSPNMSDLGSSNESSDDDENSHTKTDLTDVST